MDIKKIKTKQWFKNNRPMGRKIIITTHESQDISIDEEAKILEFLRNLRT